MTKMTKTGGRRSGRDIDYDDYLHRDCETDGAISKQALSELR